MAKDKSINLFGVKVTEGGGRLYSWTIEGVAYTWNVGGQLSSIDGEGRQHELRCVHTIREAVAWTEGYSCGWREAVFLKS